MKQIDIKDLEIKIDIINILNYVSLKKEIEIDIEGKIYIEELSNFNIPIIFSLSTQEKPPALLDAKALALNIFKDYNPRIEGTTCILKPIMAWQEIIFLNQPRMLYFDHQTDGVELFEDKELENMGWQASACDVKYREISDFIESNCDGTLVFYDNEIQFNGFVLVDDLENTKQKVESFLCDNIKDKIEKNLIDIEDDDVIEALEFFKIKV